ncbi:MULTISPECIES: hypothetical protein [Shewanella]|jgi:uncharacterized membrane protein|uniref:hypothetical protein n=1 Tax=Shewanella TaxID=22 RepID=UPI002474C4E3|nr:hypothetical protein [Shewanella holmiensis]
MIKALKLLHYLGSMLLMLGCYLHLFTDTSLRAQGMLIVASCIGIGLVMMAPFPVALMIQWAKNQDSQSLPSSDADAQPSPEKSTDQPAEKPQDKQ